MKTTRLIVIVALVLLREACLANGDRDLAIKNYRRSLELNPKNTNASDVLKKLKQK